MNYIWKIVTKVVQQLNTIQIDLRKTSCLLAGYRVSRKAKVREETRLHGGPGTRTRKPFWNKADISSGFIEVGLYVLYSHMSCLPSEWGKKCNTRSMTFPFQLQNEDLLPSLYLFFNLQVRESDWSASVRYSPLIYP